MSGPTPEEARAFLRTLTRALSAVAVLALVFTAVNVTLFATSRGIPWPIAILLDPMLALALIVALYAEARLAAWGVRPTPWSAALRWFTGTAATLMNTWTSIWPTGRIGWPTDADPAGVLLHATPTVLLVLLTETVAAYRRAAAPLIGPIGESDGEGPYAPSDPGEHRPAELGDTPRADRLPVTGRPPIRHPLKQIAEPVPKSVPFAPLAAPAVDGAPQPGPVVADSAPTTPSLAPVGDGEGGRPAVGDVWERAVALDQTVRAATGRPVSVWRLRRDLHVGPHRARQLHTQLLAHQPADPPAHS
ncbi:extensin [Streptomyces sp. T-3]|nr:extensin [Streptomyces sp. T-3]